MSKVTGEAAGDSADEVTGDPPKQKPPRYATTVHYYCHYLVIRLNRRGCRRRRCAGERSQWCACARACAREHVRESMPWCHE